MLTETLTPSKRMAPVVLKQPSLPGPEAGDCAVVNELLGDNLLPVLVPEACLGDARGPVGRRDISLGSSQTSWGSWADRDDGVRHGAGTKNEGPPELELFGGRGGCRNSPAANVGASIKGPARQRCSQKSLLVVRPASSGELPKLRRQRQRCQERVDDIGIVLLPAATAQALANASLLFLPSAKLLALEAVHQPAAVLHSSAVQKEEAEETTALPAAVVAATAAMADRIRASFADLRGSFQIYDPFDVENVAQQNAASAGLSPRDPRDQSKGWIYNPNSALWEPTVVTMTSSGGQLAGSNRLRSSAAEAQGQGPMPGSADPLLEGPRTSAGLPLQPPLPPGSSSSGGSSVLVPAPCLPPSSPPSVQSAQLVSELPSYLSLLPTGPLESPRHAPNTNKGSKFSSSSSLTTAQVPASGPSRTCRPKVLVIVNQRNAASNWFVERAPYRGEIEAVLVDDDEELMGRMVARSHYYWNFDAFLIDESYTKHVELCKLLRQHEVDRNKPEMPSIGIYNNVKGSDLEKYAMSGFSAILERHINEPTVGKWLCNYLTTYEPPSNESRAQLKRGDIADVMKPFYGFIAFPCASAPPTRECLKDEPISKQEEQQLLAKGEACRRQRRALATRVRAAVEQSGACLHKDQPRGAHRRRRHRRRRRQLQRRDAWNGGRRRDGAADPRAWQIVEFRVVREVVKPRAAAVLAELTVGDATRQHWGATEAAAVAAGEGGNDIGIVLLPAATAQALENAALLFLPSAGSLAVETVKQAAAVPHSSTLQKEAAVETAALPAGVVAATAAMEDPKEQASPTCVAPSSLTIHCSSLTVVLQDVNSMPQLNVPNAGLSPHDQTEGAATHLAHAAVVPMAVAKTSSGGQLAGSYGLRSSAAEAQVQGPMPASADPLLDTPTTAAGLPLQPPLPPGSLSSGGSSFVPAPCLSPPSPSVQKPQLVCELPSTLSPLPTGPLPSVRHVPTTKTGSKLSSSSSFITAQSASSGPSKVRGPKRRVTTVELEVVAWAHMIYRREIRGEKIDALLLDERFKVEKSFKTCRLVRHFEVDRNLPEMPIIGISAEVKRADLKKYAILGYSAILGKPINERTAGKRLCNYLTTYKPLSTERRAQLKREDIAEVKKPFNGFIAFE
eukprot:SM000331S12519  [mRNA]  locus=s331:49699:60850:+ [translate_table: standard]